MVTPVRRAVVPLVVAKPAYRSIGEGWEGIEASEYWWCEPEEIPPREFLYGRHLVRDFLSVTVAPGGVGKSSLAIVEQLAMASGRNLLGIKPARPLNCWFWNLEDPLHELRRRIAAACKLYGLTKEDLGAGDGGYATRLLVDSGRDMPLKLAEMGRDGPVIVRPVVDEVIRTLRRFEVDVLTVDPFVSSHSLAENNTEAMDLVAKEWSGIASAAACAIHLVHHTRKGLANEVEVTTETARGAKSLTDAARSVRVLNLMTKDEAERFGVEGEARRRHFRTYLDKGNLAPPAEASDWFRLESVNLNNAAAAPDPVNDPRDADEVGVVVRWSTPRPLDGLTADDVLRVQQAVQGHGACKESILSRGDWAGVVVGEVLGIDVSTAAGKSRVKLLIKTWIDNGALKVVKRLDATRRERAFVEVGAWHDEAAPV